MKSLRWRLNAGLFLSLLVLFMVQWGVVSIFLQRLTDSYIISRLEHDAESLLVAVSIDPDGKLTIDEGRLTPIYRRPYSGHYYVVRAGDQVLRSRSLWDYDTTVDPLAAGKHDLHRFSGPQQQPLMVWESGFEKRGVKLTIGVSEDLSSINTILSRFHLVYGSITVLALVALIVFQSASVRAGLRPLEQVRRDLQRLERGEIEDLGERVPSEVLPLVSEVNRLLKLMVERLSRSRNALGNLAHALKMPLTALAQLRDDPALRDHPQLQVRFTEHTETIRNLMERELKRARLSGAPTPGRLFQVGPELEGLLHSLRLIYRDKHLDLQARIPSGAEYTGDREDMLELLGNLLDNACKWANECVRLTVYADDGLRLSVEDDGPGCPPEELQNLTRRGVRIDESAPGHGLGLAIAKDVVEDYGGEIRFGASESLGGFRVDIDLPPRGV